jgi:spore maturation protein SpmB
VETAVEPPGGAPGPEPAPGLKARLGKCLRAGTLAGGKQALWLLALMIPISLGMKLLAWSGALGWLAGWLRPAMGLLGLPGESAVALVTGAAAGIYSGIAALGQLDLTGRQMTILAFFMLSCHNLPVEVAVQRKAGSSAWRIVLLRVIAAVAGAALLNLIMPAGRGLVPERALQPAVPWLSETAWLIGKVAVLVVGLMVLQKFLAEFGVARGLARLLAPVLLVLGLPRRTAFLWITMNTLGLAYGGAVLIEEARSGELSREEVELLNRSAAVCHSLLEDTVLFAAIGARAPWITVPRLVMAAAAAWGYRAWQRWRAAGGH